MTPSGWPSMNLVPGTQPGAYTITGSLGAGGPASARVVRSLERGLRVLLALQDRPISSLHELYEKTGISKPALLRILQTLETSGFVARRLADGHYRISSNVTNLVRKRDQYEAVAEAAAPVLDRLCQRVSWPSDLMVPAGDHMEVRESSRVRTPFSIYFLNHRMGTPVNWVLTAIQQRRPA